MPACMIIFKILFSQKHCTLYLYSNGHVWIPIYEFEICISVKKHANRMLNIGIGIRMNILMLDTRNVEQTKDVRMYT